MVNTHQQTTERAANNSNNKQVRTQAEQDTRRHDTNLANPAQRGLSIITKTPRKQTCDQEHGTCTTVRSYKQIGDTHLFYLPCHHSIPISYRIFVHH